MIRFFFFNDTATTEIYTLSLHDALPISLLEKYAGVKLAKEHQKADWSRRPLSPAMLAYAAADTAHLPALREQLRARLTALGRLAWAEEEFARLEDLRWTGAADGAGPDAVLRGEGAQALTPRQL